MPAPGWLRLDLYQAWPKVLRPQGRPRTRCRDYISQLAREHLGIPHKELESVSCDKEVWVVTQPAVTAIPIRKSGRKMNE